MDKLDMNIKIEVPYQGSGKKRPSLLLFFLPVLMHPFGLASAVLLLLLIGSESYYQNILKQDNALYIGGAFGLAGLAFMLPPILKARKNMLKYLDEIERNKTTVKFYVAFTDTHLEWGTSGIRLEQRSWRLLDSFKEDKKRFTIEIDGADVRLNKKYISSEETNEIRQCLEKQMSTNKSSKPVALT
jgi:hypothetical protein